PELLTTQTEAFLSRTFQPEGPKATWFESPKKQNAWVYLNRGTLKALNLEPAKVERAAADWMKTQPGVLHVFTRADMDGPVAEDLVGLRDMVRRSFVPESSGDLLVVLKPYYIFSSPVLSSNPAKDASYRASHGMPH